MSFMLSKETKLDKKSRSALNFCFRGKTFRLSDGNRGAYAGERLAFPILETEERESGDSRRAKEREKT
jgi:hypothetical protein